MEFLLSLSGSRVLTRHLRCPRVKNMLSMLNKILDSRLLYLRHMLSAPRRGDALAGGCMGCAQIQQQRA